MNGADVEDVEDMAERADRAMRTSAARNTAQAVHTLVSSTDDVLAALTTWRGWSRRNEREFVCAFGDRSATVAVPSPFDARTMARLITRAEVNVFLAGGADDLLVRELQALAHRELEQLFEE
jgi:hypothetical protein